MGVAQWKQTKLELQSWVRISKSFKFEIQYFIKFRFGMKSQTFRVFSGNEKSLLKIKIITRCIFQTIKCAVAGHQYMVMDLPLLFEAGVMVKYMHKIIGTATTLFYNINLVIQI